MNIQEDILAELTAESITKLIGEPGQGDINILKAELAEQAAKIKATKDLVGKGCNYGFLASGWGKKVERLYILKQSNGLHQKTQEDMITPSKPRKWLLTEARGRKNMQEK